MTALRFEGVDAPSFRRADIQSGAFVARLAIAVETCMLARLSEHAAGAFRLHGLARRIARDSHLGVVGREEGDSADADSHTPAALLPRRREIS